MLSIIICTYKRPQLVLNAVQCAMQVALVIESEIIVINDCMGDVLSLPKDNLIRIYDNPSRGLASARNYGAKQAKGNMLLFVDDDIQFSLSNVQSLMEGYSKKVNTCWNPNWRYPNDLLAKIHEKQFGRFLIKHELINYKGWVPELPWNNGVFEAEKLAGFFILMPYTIFRTSGGFNENFTNQGVEDDEFCYRLKAMGIKMFIDADNYVLHNEVDRMLLSQRLKRYENGAVNRRKALALGHKQYAITYSRSREIILRFLLFFFPFFVLLAHMIPNKKILDVFYFRITHLLIALSIFKGYQMNE